jgi:hypothetical protein
MDWQDRDEIGKVTESKLGIWYDKRSNIEKCRRIPDPKAKESAPMGWVNDVQALKILGIIEENAQNADGGEGGVSR